MSTHLTLEVSEGELERIGNAFADAQRHDRDQWTSIVYALALHARQHHRAMLHEFAGPAPRLAGIHVRVIIETTITLDFLGDNPDVRVPLWAAEGHRQRAATIRDWLKLIDEGHDSTDRDEVAAMLRQREALMKAEVAASKRAAESLDVPVESWPRSLQGMHAGKVPLRRAYAQGFRPLSDDAHVSVGLFAEEAFVQDVDGRTRIAEQRDETEVDAMRGLAASAMAAIYEYAAELVGLPLVADARRVREVVMSLEAE